MNNHNYNNLTIKSNKSNAGFQDSDTSLRSPNSPSSPERKHCAFVRDLTGYGFKITGNAPVKVQAVRQKGSAWNAGLRANDIIIKVNGTDVIDKQHSDVVALIRKQTMVELIVTTGENVSSSNISNIPIKAIPRSPRNNNTKSAPHDTAKPNNRKPFSKPVGEVSSPKENSKQSSNKSSLSDHSRRSTESGSKIFYSSSDCSISTTSTETDWNSGKKIKNPNKSSKSSIGPDNVARKQQSHKPQKPVKQNATEAVEFIPNKISSEKLNLFKSSISSDKELTVKSHSYNAPSNKSSKLFPNSKKSNETTRNKTIPSDGVKSNNMLSSERTTNEFTMPQISYDTLPKQLSPNKSNHLIQKARSISSNTHIMGRDFDIDNMDNEDSDVSLTILDLLSSTEDSISRPGLVSVLILYVNELPNDLNTMMLYYACKFYKTFESRKDFHTDAPRLANEIITTFLLEKSPLFVNMESEIVEGILKNLKLSDNIKGIFNSLLKFLFHRLETIVDNVKGRIQRGMLLQNELPSLTNEENRDFEMSLLHRTLGNIINKDYKEPDPTDILIAKQIGLATIFQYFYKPLFVQSSHLRSRSTDGLSTLGNQVKLQPIADLFKVNLFCSAYQQKLFSSIRKKPKSVNGHSIIEAVCQVPEDCAVCDGLLWGPSPQGVFCTMCQSYFHVNCKKKIKASCTRKSRKPISTSGNKEEKIATTFLGRLSRKSSTSSIKNINSHVGENNHITGSSIFHNGSLIQDDKTNFNIDDNIGVFKAKSEDQLHRMNSNSGRYGSVHDVSLLNHNNSIDNNTGGGIFNDIGTVQVQELIQDESIEDPDMKVDESFDAGAEIQAIFPNIDAGVDKNRLIVLLEFYHKTRYILMNLKRFLYKLVNKWPQNQLNYFKALSLDCVEPFVLLIKSLVTTIKNSVEDQGFVNLEIAVYNWLSEDNDKRLKEWITLSSNLCCTNSLNIVKQLKQTTMRAIPELTNLLNAKIHKMIIVEELTQIRPLLISLPLIVKNIIKCLSKSEALYSEQLFLWKETSIKMDYLCEYIDKCCVPLVDWVNNGFITKRADRNDWSSRIKETENTNVDIIEYCADFPRTLFHFPIFDFQMAKVFSWYKNIKKGQGPETQIHYLKKGTEVLLIFYKSFIAVLQKENDHYYLKPIKPLKSITERLFPIIEASGSHVSKGGQEEDSFILNIITDKNSVDASLVRVGFSHKEFVDNWIDYLGTFTHNLARSISLYKLNDIKEFPRSNSLLESNTSFLGRLRSSESFSSPSTISVSPSVMSTPFQSEPTNEKVFQSEKIVPESPIMEKEVISSSEELLNGLTKSVNILNDQRKEISKFLNIPDEHYDNALELITKQGPTTIQDTTLLLYSLCGPMIEHTRQLILAGSEGPKINEIVKKDEIKETMACILNLYRHLESVNYPNEVIKKPIITERKTSKRKLISTPSSVSRIQLVSDLCDLGQINKMTPNEIIEDVQDIIDEIIDKSVVQVQKARQPVMKNSYKYVPEKCLISSTRDSTERSPVSLMPTYLNFNHQVDDTIVTTRAQIVLNKNSNNSI